MNRYAKGSRAENERKRHYEAQGVVVIRAAGSMGPCDLVLLKAGEPAIIVEVKSTSSKTVWRASRTAESIAQFKQLETAADLGFRVRYDIRFNGGRWASFDELPPDGIFRGPKE